MVALVPGGSAMTGLGMVAPHCPSCAVPEKSCMSSAFMENRSGLAGSAGGSVDQKTVPP
jgi:hypothetical protein